LEEELIMYDQFKATFIRFGHVVREGLVVVVHTSLIGLGILHADNHHSVLPFIRLLKIK